jgi:carboxyl-terminal processing protease
MDDRFVILVIRDEHMSNWRMKMVARNKRLVWIASLLVSAALVTVAVSKPAADAGNLALKSTPDQTTAALMAARFLTRMHYKAEPLDEAMSRQIFDRYLDALDADRLFFLKADVDGFTPARDRLGRAIYDQDLSVPFTIFNVYIQRLGERTAYAREQLKKGFDFSKDESYQYQREKTPWAQNVDEVNDVWRKRVKNDWLRLKLAGKDDAKIRETLDKRYANYVDRIRQLNSEDVFSTFMNAYAMAIEPHTNYLGPRQAENFDIAMKLSLEGIGAVLQRDEDYTAIREIVPGGPASLSGKVKIGDRIVGVGQGESGPLADVVGWRLDDVVDKIRGAKDTTVRLEILPADAGQDGKHMMVALVRKKVVVEEQAAKSSVIETKDGDVTHRIGVISLPTFYQDFEAHRRGDKNYKSATRDVDKLLADLKKQKVEGVLIDLRNDGGGSLNEATDLTGLFIDKGPVVQVRSADGRITPEDDQNAGMAWSGPLAVLVNRNSASASEIFAAAIQDYGRGLIIGEPTYGKGTVQNLLDLDQMHGNEKPTYGELKMTIAQFFRINGGSTQLRGVTPDIGFPVTGDFDQNGEQSFDNALPWTSIAAADYTPAGDLKSIVPMLEVRHEKRAANDKEWQSLQADIADARKLRKDTMISLNEQARRQERDEQEAKHKERHPELADAATTAPATSATSATGATGEKAAAAPAAKPVANAEDRKAADPDAVNRIATVGSSNAAKGSKRAGDSANQDDGLQADERSLKFDLDEEKKRKAAKDVVLNEASRILADEVDLLHADTKLAARVLPHGAMVGKDAVD